MSKTKHGKALEAFLDSLHAQYRRQGRCIIAKVPTPVQVTKHPKRNGKIEGRLMPPVWVDYTGVVMGGIAVALEAKCTIAKGQSFDLSKQPKHQRQLLTEVHAMGGIAAYYVRRMVPAEQWTRDGTPAVSDYLVPIAFIDELGKQSFRWDEVERYRVPHGKTWIDALGIWNDGDLSWKWYLREGW